MEVKNYYSISIETGFSDRYRPLAEVTDVSAKTNRVVEDVFGSDYQRIISKVDRGSFYKTEECSKITKTVSCVIASGLFGIGTVEAILDAGQLALGFFGGGFLCMGVSYFTPENKKTDLEAVMSVCNAITDFSNAYETFKLNVDSSQVKGLFEKFDIIKELFLDEEFKDFKGSDFKLFTETGKIFLMDAIVQALGREENCVMDSWNRFDIKKPESYFFDQFLQLKERINPNEIADKMIEIFKVIIQSRNL